MKAKYTPWTIVERNNDKMIPMVNIEGITSGGHPIVISQVWERSQARLIATVPEMVEVLRDIRDLAQACIDGTYLYNALTAAKFREQARAALSQAGVE